MGYITFTISNRETIAEYILFHADYLNESWLAEVNSDGSTKILRQFKCKNFENCFSEAVAVIVLLGTVSKISVTDLDENYGYILQNEIIAKSNIIPSSPTVAAFNVSWTRQSIMTWISNTLPRINIAN